MPHSEVIFKDLIKANKYVYSNHIFQKKQINSDWLVPVDKASVVVVMRAEAPSLAFSHGGFLY